MSSMGSPGQGLLCFPSSTHSTKGCSWVNTDVAQLSSITQLHTVDAQAWPWIRKGGF